MKANTAGVVRHEIQFDGQVPVRVSLWLKGGAEVTVDLVTGVVDDFGGVSEKKRQWLAEIAAYLARQELLYRVQQQQRPDGTHPLEFDPRPDGRGIWWG